MGKDIAVYVNGMGFGGGTLVVVAVGVDVYGATDANPVAALYAAATKASKDLGRRGEPIEANVIVERGRRCLDGRRGQP